MANSIGLSMDNYDIIDSGVIVINNFKSISMKVIIDDVNKLNLKFIFHKEKSEQKISLDITNDENAILHIYDVYNGLAPAPNKNEISIATVNNKLVYVDFLLQPAPRDNFLFFYTWYLSNEVITDGI